MLQTTIHISEVGNCCEYNSLSP